MQYIDYICIGVCCFHFLLSFFQSLFSGKKIEKICTKCLQPIIKGEEHQCSDVLNSEQLEALSRFVDLLVSSKKEG